MMIIGSSSKFLFSKFLNDLKQWKSVQAVQGRTPESNFSANGNDQADFQAIAMAEIVDGRKMMPRLGSTSIPGFQCKTSDRAT